MRDVTYMNRYGQMPQPVLDPQHYSTYMVRRPKVQQWRLATCEEYGCLDFFKGFLTTVLLDTELGQKQYYFLTHDTLRKYEIRRPSMGVAEFIYGPGNECFHRDQHRVYDTRPPNLLVVGGDWRGNPSRSIRQHTKMEFWVEDFAINQAQLAHEINKG